MNKALATAIVLVTAVTLHADTLEEKKFWKGQMDYIQQNLDTASKACDVKFTFDWVGKPALRDAAKAHYNSPNGICSNIVDEVASLCRSDADSKSAVKAKITGFTCGYAKPRTLDLKGGIATYMSNNEEANFGDWAKPWLEKHL